MRKSRQFTPDEDAPLLLSWHRGDLTAFETLTWKYQKRIFNLALLLTGVQKIACEITENSFLTAFREIRSLKSSVRFSAWLVAITLKECRNLNDYRTEEPESSAETDTTFSDEGSYATAMHRKLELCIRALPVELGELILLRYVRGYSLEKIEEILQINGELLLSRLFAAQETLACWLKSDTENPAEFSGMKTEGSSVHAEIRRNFSAYLDNSTEGTEKELTKAHLKSCGSCREALAELEWMVEDIKSLPDVEPPVWLAAAVMAKIKNSPANPPNVTTTSPLLIQSAAAVLLMAFIGTSAYLLLRKSEPASELPPSVNLTASPPPAEKKPEAGGTDFTSLSKGAFKGPVTRSDSSPAVDKASRPSIPLPAALPSEPQSQAAPTSKSAPPAVTGKSEQNQRREKAEVTPSLLPDWGEPPLQSRTPLKKAPLPRSRTGEIAVLLNTAEPVAAGHDIESAVTSLGGNVSGRAYSSGHDILYIRIEVEKFFDLMSRLEKIGRLQELPQLPEGAEGAVDLTIRW